MCRWDPLKSGRLNCNFELANIIHEAWQVDNWQYSAPSWTEQEFHKINATSPGGIPSRAVFDLMLQSALEQRLGMRYHIEERQMPVYALLVGKGGMTLPPAKEGGALIFIAYQRVPRRFRWYGRSRGWLPDT